jgi:non-ribosomal peptide synthetase component F
MAGLSANMLPLRTSLAGNPRFVEILQRVSETTLAALSRQEYPYQLWIDELRRRRAEPDLRLFSAFFVVHEEAFSLTFDGLTARWFGSDAYGNTFDSRSLQWDQRQQIAFAANDTGRGWRIALLGSPSLFDEEALQHLLTQWVAIVRQAIADPERRLADIELPAREGVAALPVDSAVALERDELDHLFA